MMTPEQKIKAIAELDGFSLFREEVHPAITYLLGIKDGEEDIVPEYLTSLDAIIPVIEKLDDDKQLDFIRCLVEDVLHDFLEVFGTQLSILFATPEQLSDALLKACGKWQE